MTNQKIEENHNNSQSVYKNNVNNLSKKTLFANGGGIFSTPLTNVEEARPLPLKVKSLIENNNNILGWKDFIGFEKDHIMSFHTTKYKNEQTRLPRVQRCLYSRVNTFCKEHEIDTPPKSCFDPQNPIWVSVMDLSNSENISNNLPYWYMYPFRASITKEDGTTKQLDGHYPLHIHGQTINGQYGVNVPVYIKNQDIWVLTLEWRIVCGGYSLGIFKGMHDKGEEPNQTAKREVSEEFGGINLDRIKHKMISLNSVYANNGLSFNRENVYLIVIDDVTDLTKGIDELENFGKSNEAGGKTVFLSTEQVEKLMRHGWIDDVQSKSAIFSAIDKIEIMRQNSLI